MLIVVRVAVEAYLPVNVVPYFRTIIARVIIGEFVQIVIVITGHIPSRPTIQLKIVIEVIITTDIFWNLL